MSHPATYHRPQSLAEALRLAADPANVILAGGTMVQPQINKDQISPSAVLDISRVPETRGISTEDVHVRIGATTTLAEIAADPDVRRLAPVLIEAVESIACPEVRYQATLGGNIEAGFSSMDSLPALLVLDAQVELASSSGRRRLALTDHIASGRTTCAAGELLVAIEVNAPREWAGRFVKLGVRKAFTPSILSLAVMLHQDRPGTIGELRVAAAGYADRALRLRGVEAAATGRTLDGGTIDELTARAMDDATAVSDLYRSAAYRRRALAELFRRILQEIAAPQ